MTWNVVCKEVASKIREHVLPFSTPTSKALSNEYGDHHGSTSYVWDGNSHFLLTNEHVARATSSFHLTHQFWGCDDIFRIVNPWVTVSAPIDSAASIVNQ